MNSSKFSGMRMLISTGLIYAFVGALGLTVAQLTNAYMVLDPEVTMNRTYLGLGFSFFIIVQESQRLSSGGLSPRKAHAFLTSWVPLLSPFLR